MSGTPRAESYRAVLALPSAATTFTAALVGRLSYGLLPLSLLLTVRDAAGSFATAGLALALVGLTSLALPAKSRLVDRHGARRVLPVLALVCSLALSGIALLPNALGCLVLAGVAGLAAPPLGPAMRALWSRFTEHTPLRPTAYSLDAVAEEALYVLGPVLVGVLLLVGPARAALLVTSALMLLGTLAMVAAAPAPPDLGSPSSTAWAPWRTPAFVALVSTVLVVALALSLTNTAVAAASRAAGRPSAAGWIDAALAVGSVVGGLLWGRGHRPRAWSRQVGLLGGVLVVGPAVAAAGASLVGTGAGLAVSGLGLAPLFVVAYLASDELAPADRRTEASTWVNTGNNVGSAAGAALGGVVVQHLGARPAYAFAAALLLLLAIAAASAHIIAGGGHLQPRTRRPARAAAPAPPGGRRRPRAERRRR